MLVLSARIPMCGSAVKSTCEAQVASLILERAGARRYKCPHVLEGGSIHVDGEGCGPACSLTRTPSHVLVLVHR